MGKHITQDVPGRFDDFGCQQCRGMQMYISDVKRKKTAKGWVEEYLWVCSECHTHNIEVAALPPHPDFDQPSMWYIQSQLMLIPDAHSAIRFYPILRNTDHADQN